MKAHKTTQTMKPATAAKKLGIHLPATPAEFQEGVVSREELDALSTDPPQWLRDLRLNGPHDRAVTAARLNVSVAGLARGGVTEALTTEQIEALKADPPEWLRQEREIQAEFRQEAVRAQENSEVKAGRGTGRDGGRDGGRESGRGSGRDGGRGSGRETGRGSGREGSRDSSGKRGGGAGQRSRTR